MTKKKINIFGTSGSIGQSTLNVLRERKELYDFAVSKYAPGLLIGLPLDFKVLQFLFVEQFVLGFV